MKTILDNGVNNATLQNEKIEKDIYNDDNLEDVKFNKKRDLSILITTICLCIVVLVSFNYIIALFPIAMGLLIGFIGIDTLIFLDKIIFIGNSTKRVAHNAVAISITYFSFSIMFICGFMFGNSYVSNTYASDTETNKAIYQKETNTQRDTITLDNGTNCIGGQGATSREQ